MICIKICYVMCISTDYSENEKLSFNYKHTSYRLLLQSKLHFDYSSYEFVN